MDSKLEIFFIKKGLGKDVLNVINQKLFNIYLEDHKQNKKRKNFLVSINSTHITYNKVVIKQTSSTKAWQNDWQKPWRVIVERRKKLQKLLDLKMPRQASMCELLNHKRFYDKIFILACKIRNHEGELLNHVSGFFHIIKPNSEEFRMFSIQEQLNYSLENQYIPDTDEYLDENELFYRHSKKQIKKNFKNLRNSGFFIKKPEEFFMILQAKLA